MCERMYEILTLGCNYLNYEKNKRSIKDVIRIINNHTSPHSIL